MQQGSAALNNAISNEYGRADFNMLTNIHKGEKDLYAENFKALIIEVETQINGMISDVHRS